MMESFQGFDAKTEIIQNFKFKSGLSKKLALFVEVGVKVKIYLRTLILST